jgi:hypothetical protein
LVAARVAAMVELTSPTTTTSRASVDEKLVGDQTLPVCCVIRLYFEVDVGRGYEVHEEGTDMLRP